MQAPQASSGLKAHTVRLPDKQLLAQELARLRSAAAIPGMAIDVAVDRARLGMAIGKPSIDAGTTLRTGSRFRITCAIKMFVALATLRLVHEGVLNLDATLGNYLPELGTAMDSKGGCITLGHLLSHTSGYRGLDMAEISIWTKWSWSDCVSYLQSAQQLFSPGSVFNEEHLDHAILGQVIKTVTGRTVMDLVEEMVFRPLEMCTGTVTGDVANPEFHVDGHSYSAAERRLEKTPLSDPPSELWSPSFSETTMTVHDLGNLAQALANGTIAETLGLGQEGMAALVRPVVGLPSLTSVRLSLPWTPVAFSLGCARFANHWYGYFSTGRGQSCSLVFDPEHRISLALALNVEPGPLRLLALDILFAQLHDLPPVDLRSGIRPAPVRCGFDEFFAPFNAHQMAGEYVGNTRDHIHILTKPEHVTLNLGPKPVMTFKADRSNRLVLETNRPVPLAVFMDPASGEPSLMLGMHAYKKIA